jgi:hypothetical protein
MMIVCYAASSILAIFLVAFVGSVHGERSTVSANQLSKYWIDARDVLEDLDQYQALWIKIHGCV